MVYFRFCILPNFVTFKWRQSARVRGDVFLTPASFFSPLLLQSSNGFGDLSQVYFYSMQEEGGRGECVGCVAFGGGKSTEAPGPSRHAPLGVCNKSYKTPLTFGNERDGRGGSSCRQDRDASQYDTQLPLLFCGFLFLYTSGLLDEESRPQTSANNGAVGWETYRTRLELLPQISHLNLQGCAVKQHTC